MTLPIGCGVLSGDQHDLSSHRRLRRAGFDAYLENHGSVPDPEVVSTLEATPTGRRVSTTQTAQPSTLRVNVDAGYVDARSALRRAEDGDLAVFDEGDLADQPHRSVR